MDHQADSFALLLDLVPSHGSAPCPAVDAEAQRDTDSQYPDYQAISRRGLPPSAWPGRSIKLSGIREARRRDRRPEHKRDRRSISLRQPAYGRQRFTPFQWCRRSQDSPKAYPDRGNSLAAQAGHTEHPRNAASRLRLGTLAARTGILRAAGTRVPTVGARALVSRRQTNLAS